jgi:hypothetical protein
MKLCKYVASNHATLFGTPSNPIQRSDIVIIGRLPDDSEFLVLTTATDPALVEVQLSQVTNFIFTYCQAWGLQVDQQRVNMTLEDIKAKRFAEIDAKRDEQLNAGVMFANNLYYSDSEFQTQLQAFLLAWNQGLLDSTATVAIRRPDGTIVQMGRNDVLQLAGAVLQYVQTVYAESWAAKDAVTADVAPQFS